MSDDYERASTAPDGVTHLAYLLIDRRIALCGALLLGGRRALDVDVDCMTCLVVQSRLPL